MLIMVADNNHSGVTTRSVTRSKAKTKAQENNHINHLPLSADDVPDSLSPSKARNRKKKLMMNGAVKSSEEVVHINGNGSSLLLQDHHRDRRHLQRSDDLEAERRKITLWRQPLVTLHYFFVEIFCLLKEYGIRFLDSGFLLPIFVAFIFFGLTYTLHGPHQDLIAYLQKKVLICLYWIGLGVLSSIGLGTGLHTFILYLGPHIAAVTLAAYECGTLKFPEPPYPDEILCPDGVVSTVDFVPTLWNIMSKVRLESFMWGLGTAIGELPPYFMAKAARLSGREAEELLELEALIEHEKDHPLTLSQRGKLFMEELVARVGFFGILLGASIPNPLFDLAGITCGHFLVPFSTFFGATLIGKAVIKMHIQMIFVIVTFSERHVEQMVSLFDGIPYLGPYLEQPFKEFLQKQKTNLHRTPGSASHHGDASWLQFIFEKVIICMVIYFVLSLVNSLAQNYHRRLHNPNQKGK